METKTNHKFKLKDFVPFYGLIQYMKRNKEYRIINNCSEREHLLAIYNGAIGMVSLIYGLEKLLK